MTLLLAASVAAAGCAGAAPAPDEPAAFDEDGDVPRAGDAHGGREPAAPAGGEPATAAVEAPAPIADIPTESAGSIARADLIEVLDRGAGRFLAGIEIEATFDSKRRFTGWQILRFEPADTRLGAAPLAAGDVVVAVNARPIARPRQLQAVWDELRAADALIIEGRRAGRPFALRYDIID